jgi:lipopolysaccharide biosynthesis protein
VHFSADRKVRPIAIYLPQFHPIPENDKWWGKGFTEWTNVAKAKALFKGHYQPHLPADLGFYDLRVPEVREEQAELAKAHGIYGFCYYHYWFNGRRILERPFQEVFESGTPNFPFMLCWANENWTRTWDGKDKEVLLHQQYSEEDDRLHIQSLIPYLKDDRYIRVGNRPVIAIYRSTILPDANRTVSVWREEAAKEGINLYICRFESYGKEGEQLISKAGFDAAIEFQPMGKARRIFQFEIDRQRYSGINGIANRIKRKLWHFLPGKIGELFWDATYHGSLIDYQEYIKYMLSQPKKNYKIFPGISPMWDNSARKKKNYLVFYNSTPEAYENWLKQILSSFKPFSRDENFVFINAWNEWAEGNHLEPCQKWGKGYLEATKKALEESNADKS